MINITDTRTRTQKYQENEPYMIKDIDDCIAKS